MVSPRASARWPKVDVGFEAAGEDAALESALITARLGGRVVVVGIPPTNQHAFPAKLARGKGLTIAWSRRMKAIHMLRAIEMADHGIVSLDGMITATYPLAEAAQAFDDLVARNGLKIVVKPTRVAPPRGRSRPHNEQPPDTSSMSGGLSHARPALPAGQSSSMSVWTPRLSSPPSWLAPISTVMSRSGVTIVDPARLRTHGEVGVPFVGRRGRRGRGCQGTGAGGAMGTGAWAPWAPARGAAAARLGRGSRRDSGTGEAPGPAGRAWRRGRRPAGGALDRHRHARARRHDHAGALPHMGCSPPVGRPRRERRRVRGPDCGGRKPQMATLSLPSR